MIRRESWYREASFEQELLKLVRSITKEDPDNWEAFPPMMGELSRLLSRSPLTTEEALRAFPEDFPVYLECQDESDFESSLNQQFHEDFSDWAPPFQTLEIELDHFTTKYASEEDIPRASKEEIRYEKIETLITVGVTGFFPVEYQEEFETLDEALDNAYQESLQEFNGALEGQAGRQSLNLETGGMGTPEEGPGGDWGWSFEGSFSYTAEVPFDPKGWKLIYDPDGDSERF